MKKIMILGAGIYQVPLIKRAKEMGLYTIVVSIDGNYPGFQFADKVYYINTTDVDAVLKIAKEENISGICTTGTDVAVITIGEVCDSLGLAGVSAEGARIACDKKKMKDAYMNGGVNTAAYVYCGIDEAEADIKEKSADIGYPVIVKAVDSSGSRGITVVNSDDEIAVAIDRVKKVSRKEYFIVEKYLVGDEFGAQAFVQNGEIKLVLPHGDYVYKSNTGVPIGHYAPYEGTDAVIEKTHIQVKKAIRAMGLDNCACNVDAILVDGEVYILEIGARGGATQLVELVSEFYGIDYYEYILKAALGENIDCEIDENNTHPNASYLLISEKSGLIKSMTYDSAIEEYGIVSFDYEVGDSVRKFEVGPDRIGHVITVGDSLEEAQSRLFEALDKIKIEVE